MTAPIVGPLRREPIIPFRVNRVSAFEQRMIAETPGQLWERIAEVTGKTGAELVPTTGQVKSAWAGWADPGDWERAEPVLREQFDRWLTQHDRGVAVKALRDARDEFAAAALSGIEPVLNHAVARQLHNRALKIERGW